MKQLLLGIVLCFSVVANAEFAQYSRKVVDSIFKEIQSCGLKTVDAYHPNLPYPPVQATQAVINDRFQVLAYYYESYGIGGVETEFKNPNGGFSHKIKIFEDKIKFVTPYGGTVALATRYKTVGGWGYNHHCGTDYYLSGEAFDRCVKANFVDVIATQLCRFG